MTLQLVLFHLLTASLLIFERTESKGVLYIKLNEFYNPLGRTYQGYCCDIGFVDADGVCIDQCDYVMRLIVSGLGRANDHVFLFHRPLKYNSNNIVFKQNDSSLVLTVLFDKWPQNARVKLNAFFYDYDDNDHTTTLVDWFETDLLPREESIADDTGRHARGSFKSQSVAGNRKDDKTELSLQWSAICDEGSDCFQSQSMASDLAHYNNFPFFEEFGEMNGVESSYKYKIPSPKRKVTKLNTFRQQNPGSSTHEGKNLAKKWKEAMEQKRLKLLQGRTKPSTTKPGVHGRRRQKAEAYRSRKWKNSQAENEPQRRRKGSSKSFREKGHVSSPSKLKNRKAFARVTMRRFNNNDKKRRNPEKGNKRFEKTSSQFYPTDNEEQEDILFDDVDTTGDDSSVYDVDSIYEGDISSSSKYQHNMPFQDINNDYLPNLESRQDEDAMSSISVSDNAFEKARDTLSTNQGREQEDTLKTDFDSTPIKPNYSKTGGENLNVKENEAYSSHMMTGNTVVDEGRTKYKKQEMKKRINSVASAEANSIPFKRRFTNARKLRNGRRSFTSGRIRSRDHVKQSQHDFVLGNIEAGDYLLSEEDRIQEAAFSDRKSDNTTGSVNGKPRDLPNVASNGIVSVPVDTLNEEANTEDSSLLTHDLSIDTAHEVEPTETDSGNISSRTDNNEAELVNHEADILRYAEQYLQTTHVRKEPNLSQDNYNAAQISSSETPDNKYDFVTQLLVDLPDAPKEPEMNSRVTFFTTPSPETMQPNWTNQPSSTDQSQSYKYVTAPKPFISRGNTFHDWPGHEGFPREEVRTVVADSYIADILNDVMTESNSSPVTQEGLLQNEAASRKENIREMDDSSHPSGKDDVDTFTTEMFTSKSDGTSPWELNQAGSRRNVVYHLSPSSSNTNDEITSATNVRSEPVSRLEGNNPDNTDSIYGQTEDEISHSRKSTTERFSSRNTNGFEVEGNDNTAINSKDTQNRISQRVLVSQSQEAIDTTPWSTDAKELPVTDDVETQKPTKDVVSQLSTVLSKLSKSTAQMDDHHHHDVIVTESTSLPPKQVWTSSPRHASNTPKQVWISSPRHPSNTPKIVSDVEIYSTEGTRELNILNESKEELPFMKESNLQTSKTETDKQISATQSKTRTMKENVDDKLSKPGSRELVKAGIKKQNMNLGKAMFGFTTDLPRVSIPDESHIKDGKKIIPEKKQLPKSIDVTATPLELPKSKTHSIDVTATPLELNEDKIQPSWDTGIEGNGKSYEQEWTEDVYRKMKLYQSRQEKKPSNSKLLYHSIKKLKAVTFQTAAPVHWYVTGHPAFRKTLRNNVHNADRRPTQWWRDTVSDGSDTKLTDVKHDTRMTGDQINEMPIQDKSQMTPYSSRRHKNEPQIIENDMLTSFSLPNSVSSTEAIKRYNDNRQNPLPADDNIVQVTENSRQDKNPPYIDTVKELEEQNSQSSDSTFDTNSMTRRHNQESTEMQPDIVSYKARNQNIKSSQKIINDEQYSHVEQTSKSIKLNDVYENYQEIEAEQTTNVQFPKSTQHSYNLIDNEIDIQNSLFNDIKIKKTSPPNHSNTEKSDLGHSIDGHLLSSQEPVTFFNYFGNMYNIPTVDVDMNNDGGRKDITAQHKMKSHHMTKLNEDPTLKTYGRLDTFKPAQSENARNNIENTPQTKDTKSNSGEMKERNSSRWNKQAESKLKTHPQNELNDLTWHIDLGNKQAESKLNLRPENQLNGLTLNSGQTYTLSNSNSQPDERTENFQIQLISDRLQTSSDLPKNFKNTPADLAMLQTENSDATTVHSDQEQKHHNVIVNSHKPKMSQNIMIRANEIKRLTDIFLKTDQTPRSYNVSLYSNHETNFQNTHLNTHEAEKSFQNTHLNTHEAEKGFQDTHSNTHEAEKSFQDTHFNTHEAEKSFQDTHFNTHEAEKSFQDTHSNTHEAEKSFQDTHFNTHEAEKSFQDTHFNTHEAEKKFQDTYSNTHKAEKSFQDTHSNTHEAKPSSGMPMNLDHASEFSDILTMEPLERHGAQDYDSIFIQTYHDQKPSDTQQPLEHTHKPLDTQSRLDQTQSSVDTAWLLDNAHTTANTPSVSVAAHNFFKTSSYSDRKQKYNPTPTYQDQLHELLDSGKPTEVSNKLISQTLPVFHMPVPFMSSFYLSNKPPHTSDNYENHQETSRNTDNPIEQSTAMTKDSMSSNSEFISVPNTVDVSSADLSVQSQLALKSKTVATKTDGQIQILAKSDRNQWREQNGFDVVEVEDLTSHFTPLPALKLTEYWNDVEHSDQNHVETQTLVSDNELLHSTTASYRSSRQPDEDDSTMNTQSDFRSGGTPKPLGPRTDSVQYMDTNKWNTLPPLEQQKNSERWTKAPATEPRTVTKLNDAKSQDGDQFITASSTSRSTQDILYQRPGEQSTASSLSHPHYESMHPRSKSEADVPKLTPIDTQIITSAINSFLNMPQQIDITQKEIHDSNSGISQHDHFQEPKSRDVLEESHTANDFFSIVSSYNHKETNTNSIITSDVSSHLKSTSTKHVPSDVSSNLRSTSTEQFPSDVSSNLRSTSTELRSASTDQVPSDGFSHLKSTSTEYVPSREAFHDSSVSHINANATATAQFETTGLLTSTQFIPTPPKDSSNLGISEGLINERLQFSEYPDKLPTAEYSNINSDVATKYSTDHVTREITKLSTANSLEGETGKNSYLPDKLTTDSTKHPNTHDQRTTRSTTSLEQHKALLANTTSLFGLILNAERTTGMKETQPERNDFTDPSTSRAIIQDQEQELTSGETAPSISNIASFEHDETRKATPIDDQTMSFTTKTAPDFFENTDAFFAKQQGLHAEDLDQFGTNEQMENHETQHANKDVMAPLVVVPYLGLKKPPKKALPDEPLSFVPILNIPNEMQALPERGFVLQTLYPNGKNPYATIRPPNPNFVKPKQVKHRLKSTMRDVNMDTFRKFVYNIRHGPKLQVPKQGLYNTGKDDNDTDTTTSSGASELPKPDRRQAVPHASLMNVKTVFTRYWPAVLGIAVGTIFLLAGLVTSLWCKQHRLLIQRARWTDSPQHLSEPPDTSEYATSSAASLTSDTARSSAHLV